MEDLVLELKESIIEALNLEDVKPENIDADALCLAVVLDWTPLMLSNSSF